MGNFNAPFYYPVMLKTVHGKVVFDVGGFNVVNQWLDQNFKLDLNHAWRQSISTGKPVSFRKTYIATYVFMDKGDAALFQLFWNQDVAGL